jgi:2-C-methyl-D-erythritol 2,4-cyclodiphosphate synthase/2-C-methyl-D-erythritol 4-phosphate cytidylyltransferase
MNCALIFAGGTGTRMNSKGKPKQFLELHGKPIIIYTLDVFENCDSIDEIVVACNPDWIDYLQMLLERFHMKKVVRIVPGGQTGQQSIRNGLMAIRERHPEQDDTIVLIHDGVRPYASHDLIGAVAVKAEESGAAIAAVPPKDTIRHLTEGTLNRSELCCVQTPQGFRFALLEEAFERAFEEGFYGTDDASLVERLGHDVAIVPGEHANIKITTPEDLAVEMRIGTGYDVHRLVEDRKLILGGVEIPYEKGLLGHSDADVLVHALMDALLGAAALGDIGKLFPDNDDAFKGISSIELLKRVKSALDDRGYSLGNADVTVICQKPKLAGYIEQMRVNVAEALEVDMDKISIKATTTEKLGFAGRGEGIAAEAVCLLNR